MKNFRIFKRAVGFMLIISIFLTQQSVVGRAAAQPELTVTKEFQLTKGTTFNINIMNKLKGSEYSWSSSDNTIATVNKRGIVKAVSEGSAVINCKIKTPSKTYNLKTTAVITPKAKSLSISNHMDNILIGFEQQLKVAQTPSTASETIKWSSSDKNIIKVSKDGVITGMKTGTATITAKAVLGLKTSVKITVLDEAVVTNEEELIFALTNKQLKKIILETKDIIKVNIPEGNYIKTILEIIAPNAEIENQGIFKQILIQSDPVKWTESAKGNHIEVTHANTTNLNIAEGASLSSLTILSGTANIEAVGALNKVILEGGKLLNLTGNSTDTFVILNSENAQLYTNIKVTCKVKQDAVIVLEEGAEGSSIAKDSDIIDIKVDNKTSEAISVDGINILPESSEPNTGSGSGSGPGPDPGDDDNTGIPKLIGLTLEPMSPVVGDILRGVPKFSGKKEEGVCIYIWYSSDDAILNKVSDPIIGIGSSIYIGNYLNNKYIFLEASPAGITQGSRMSVGTANKVASTRSLSANPYNYINQLQIEAEIGYEDPMKVYSHTEYLLGTRKEMAKSYGVMLSTFSVNGTRYRDIDF